MKPIIAAILTYVLLLASWSRGYCEDKPAPTNPYQLDEVLEKLSEVNGNEHLSFEMVLDTPRTGEEISLETWIVTGKDSELTLRFEPIANSDYLARSEIFECLEGIQNRSLLDTDKYLATIKGYHFLEGLCDGSQTNGFRVFIESYSGTVYISKKKTKLAKTDIFESDSLNEHYYHNLKANRAESLAGELHFRKPELKEGLPLYSLILIDKDSELTLGFEVKDTKNDLSSSSIVAGLDRMFSPILETPAESGGGTYYCTIKSAAIFPLSNPVEGAILDDLNIFIADYSGSVYISTDVEVLRPIVMDKYWLSRTIFYENQNLQKEGGSVTFPPNQEEQNELLGLLIDVKSRYPNEATIKQVFEGSPAQRAGLEPGDVIIEVEGNSFKDIENLITLLNEAKAMKKMTLTIRRRANVSIYTLALDE